MEEQLRPDTVFLPVIQRQVSDSANGPFTNLAGQTDTTLLLSSDHAGKYIRRVVTPTDSIYGRTLTALTHSLVSCPSSSDPAYSIKLNIGDHGLVHSSHRTAEAEETVTLTVTPDDGYIPKDLTVTYSSGNALELDPKDSNQYTFKMPARAVTVEAEFVPSRLSAFSFTDVVENCWAYDKIAWAYENGYMSGTSATVFNPGGTVTRQQVWMILARISGADLADMAAARAWAVVNGISDGTNPGAPVTRQQLAALLYRYAAQSGYDISVGESTNILSYADTFDVAEYAIPAMQWACGAGIIGGMSDGSLNPGGSATRAQLAVMLYRWLA